MTDGNDRVLKAISDARALLDTLVSSDWKQIHIRSGETEVFIGRDGGGANPMRAGAVPAVTPVSPPSETQATVVTAPHVATLVETLPVGAAVVAGQVVATLRVLDDLQTIASPMAGRISSVEASPGDLLDYKASILKLVEAA